MGVRLNKVLKELNIGLQTAVDFLKNKKDLGEIKEDANVNTKITVEQYNALVSAFKGDKDIKSEAEKIFAKKAKDKKAEKAERKATKGEELLEQRQSFKPLGKIDLDSVGKRPAAPVTEEKKEPKPEEKTVTETKTPEKQPEVKIEPKPAKPVTEAPKDEKKVEPKAEQKAVKDSPAEKPIERKPEKPEALKKEQAAKPQQTPQQPKAEEPQQTATASSPSI